MAKRKKNRDFKIGPLSPKSKWLTTLLSLFFGGLLFLIIMVIWFQVGW